MRIAAKDQYQNGGYNAKEGYSVGVDQAISQIAHLARQETIPCHEVREAWEVRKGGVGCQEQDEGGGDLNANVQWAVTQQGTTDL